MERLKKALKENRLAIIIGAGIAFNATADVSGEPFPRITWTGLIQNGLDYLVEDNYVDSTDRRIRQAYEALVDPGTNELLDAANILGSELTQHNQFPT
jgi:hypothetical protein